MTNLITLTIPNDDHIALRAFGKALEEMALAHGAEPKQNDARFKCNKDFPAFEIPSIRTPDSSYPLSPSDLPEVDTTAQQVESLSDEQIADDLLVAASEFLNVPAHVLTGQEVPPTTNSTGTPRNDTAPAFFREAADKVLSEAIESGYLGDKSGTPWDERIHSASKALNSDGTWRLRRKPKDMDESEWAATIQRVQDELRFPQEPVPVTPSGEELCIDEGCDHHGTPHICVTPEPPVTPPGDDFHTDADVVTEQTVAGIPPLPVPPPVVVAPPVNIGIYQGGAGTIGSGSTGVEPTWDFPRLMTFLTERHGKIDVATVNTLLAQDGMLSVQELNAHPDKIGPFVARVKAHLGE